jgi:hypothetical protein
MSVDNPDVIDIIGVETVSESLVLTISDHFDWSEEAVHFEMLEAKLNAYLRFVESGELEERYPSGRGRRIVFRIVAIYPLSESAQRFYDEAGAIVEGAGFALEYVLSP